jgi:hypothetical protein
VKRILPPLFDSLLQNEILRMNPTRGEKNIIINISAG